MSFFDSFPEPPPPPPPGRMNRPLWQSSERVIPVSVTTELMLARTEAIAAAIGGIRAYPNGLEFTVHLRLRREDDEFPGLLHDPFGDHPPRRPGDRREQLRLGVLFADGRRAATGTRRMGRDYSETGEPLLQSAGSSGTGLSWNGDFWLYPLPPDGSLTFVLSWPAYGVTEATGEIDGTAIRTAASRAVELWPEDPDEEPVGGSTSRTVSATRLAADPE